MPAYRFGDFTLDMRQYALARDGVPVAAPPRQLDLLAYLLARPAQLVTRDELFEALWPDTHVTDNALTQLVSELRHTLSDASSSPQFIQTVARRGYRFVADVQVLDRSPDDASPPTNARERRSRETSNLEALRAATEGRLKLEALDSTEIEAAVADFDRALDLDPSFAAAYVGRANARFWQYERGRASFRPDSDLLAAAVADARRGIALAPELAEAHGTLAYLLTAAGRSDDARAAARDAIELEPKHWSHHFRLGNAAWGNERIEALRRCLQLYPAFPFAHFQTAMVHVARQALEPATRILDEGISLLNDSQGAHSRFPASGLFWLRGSIRLTEGDAAGALADLESEISAGTGALYAKEFSVAALNSKGFALLSTDRAPDAEQVFKTSLSTHPEQARAHLGLAEVAHGRGQTDLEARALEDALGAIVKLRQGGRRVEAALMQAGRLLAQGQPDDAVSTLDRLVSGASPEHAGWSIPVDPLFRWLADDPAFERVLRQLATQAA